MKVTDYPNNGVRTIEENNAASAGKPLYTYAYSHETGEYMGYEEAEYDFENELMLPAWSTVAIPSTPKNGLKSNEYNWYDEKNMRWVPRIDYRVAAWVKDTQEQGINPDLNGIAAELTTVAPPKSGGLDVNGDVISEYKWSEKHNKWAKDADLVEKKANSEATNYFYDTLSKGYLVANVASSIDGKRMDCYPHSVLQLDGGVRIAEMLNESAIDIRTYENETIRITTKNARKLVTAVGRHLQLRLKDKWSGKTK